MLEFTISLTFNIENNLTTPTLVITIIAYRNQSSIVSSASIRDEETMETVKKNRDSIVSLNIILSELVIRSITVIAVLPGKNKRVLRWNYKNIMEYRISAVRHVTDDRKIKSFALLGFDWTSCVAVSVSVRVKIRPGHTTNRDPAQRVFIYYIISYRFYFLYYYCY